MAISTFTDVQKNVRIYAKEFLNNAKHGISYLYIIWRRLMVIISKIEPIGNDIKAGILRIKFHAIEHAEICSETVSSFIGPHLIGRAIVYS